ncbi:MAG: VOC family protein [Acidobacteriota bacterium]|nr:VOC family protein [Acidobacteriota bacterium]MDH3786755.1 VOC family protein [Acidobacteriota bacterium]
MKLEGIDHVALGVRDVSQSVAWYRQVLELERMHEGVWGDSPAMVGIGNTALALFPIQAKQVKAPPGKDTVAMRHVAFRANRSTFVEAQARLERLGIEVEFQDHEISHSIYFLDPDGHEIEITSYDVHEA